MNPPLLLRSDLTGQVYVVTRYDVLADGLIESHEKHNVTEQFGKCVAAAFAALTPADVAESLALTAEEARAIVDPLRLANERALGLLARVSDMVGSVDRLAASSGLTLEGRHGWERACRRLRQAVDNIARDFRP